MDNITLQRIKDLLAKNQRIGIVIAPHANLDQTCAGVSLYLSLKAMEKEVSIASPTDVLVAVSSVVGINKVKRTLGGDGGDLIVSFPYKDGEIEKVSYTLDNGFLNIVVRAGEKGLTFTEKDVMYKRDGKLPELLFLIGVQKLSFVREIYNPETTANITVVNIDNRADNEGYGDVVVVAPKCSSVSEQIADFLTLLEPQVQIDVDLAQNLLSGIMFATRNFEDERTSSLAFEMAGILMRKGAVRLKKQERNDKPPFSSGHSNPRGQFFPPKQQQPMNQPQQQSQPVQQPQQPFQEKNHNPKPQQTPPDWLAPKVYKGSSVV